MSLADFLRYLESAQSNTGARIAPTSQLFGGNNPFTNPSTVAPAAAGKASAIPALPAAGVPSYGFGGSGGAGGVFGGNNQAQGGIISNTFQPNPVIPGTATPGVSLGGTPPPNDPASGVLQNPVAPPSPPRVEEDNMLGASVSTMDQLFLDKSGDGDGSAHGGADGSADGADGADGSDGGDSDGGDGE